MKTGKGIMEQLKSSNVYPYKTLTEADVTKIINDIYKEALSKKAKSRTYVVYTNELNGILITIGMSLNPLAEEIKRLYSQISIYDRLLDMWKLKEHHILVGYSTMKLYQVTFKKDKLRNTRDLLMNKIKEIYYDNRNKW